MKVLGPSKEEQEQIQCCITKIKGGGHHDSLVVSSCIEVASKLAQAGAQVVITGKRNGSGIID